MTSQTQAICDAALALPEAERELLVERLLELLPEEGEEMTEDELLADGLVEMTEDELLAELDRRRADFMEGKVKPIPASELWLDE